jgi:hypothetical protein
MFNPRSLTVSPFRPSYLQPPAVHPKNNRFITPLFSASSELLFSQLLCFHNHLRCPLVFQITAIRSLREHAAPPNALTTFRINTCKSVSKQTTLSPFRMNTYAKPGGGGHTSATTSRSLRLRVIISPVGFASRLLQGKGKMESFNLRTKR